MSLLDPDIDLPFDDDYDENDEDYPRISGSQVAPEHAVKGEPEASSTRGRKAGSVAEIEERRRKVFFKLMEGKKINQIALELDVSPQTIQLDKTYIESAAYDAVKSQVGKKSVYITMTCLHVADWVTNQARLIAEGKRVVKKKIRTTDMTTGEPVYQTIEIEPSISDINTSLKVMLDAAKTKADIALNNYVFIAESEALKKLESDVLKIDLDYEDTSQEPTGFVLPPPSSSEQSAKEDISAADKKENNEHNNSQV